MRTTEQLRLLADIAEVQLESLSGRLPTTASSPIQAAINDVRELADQLDSKKLSNPFVKTTLFVDLVNKS